MLTSFQRKSRIIKYSSDLPCENVMRKYDALWTGVASRAARPKKKKACFRKSAGGKFFYLSPLCTVEKQTSKTKEKKKTRILKNQEKQRK